MFNRKADKLKAGRDNFDDGMGDMGEFDFGMEAPKSRTPAQATLKGVKDAAKSHFTNESTIRRYVGKALPGEYGEAFDTYTDSRDKVRDAIGDVKRTLKQPVNEFSKAIASKIPASMKRTRKFVDYMAEATEEYKGAKFDKEAEESKAITGSIEQLFSAQEMARKDERDLDKARGDIEKTAELIRFKSQINALNSIARSGDILAKQAQGITVAYQKKSLELQYRTVFALRDMLTEQKLLTAQNRTQLDAIRHNTSLPETQKLQLSERFMNAGKNKFIDKAYGSFANGGKNVVSAMTKQFTSSLKEMSDSVAMGLQMGAMGASMDMDLDLEEEDPIIKRRRKIANAVTSGILSMFDDKIAGGLKSVLNKNPKIAKKIKRGASHIKNGLKNGDAMMREFSMGDQGDDGMTMSFLRDLVSMAIPGRDTDRTVKTHNGMEDYKGPAVYSGAAQRSITEVMPGYLARILQELQISRTGDAKLSITHFDPANGKFVSKGDLIAKYNKELNQTNSTSKKEMDGLFNEVNIAGGGKMMAGTGSTMGASLLNNRSRGSAMTPNALMRESYWKQTRSAADAAQLAKAYRAYFDSPDGKFSGSDKALSARDSFLDKVNSAHKGMNDPRAKIQDAYTKGHGSIMEEMGWTDDKADGPEIKTDKIIDSALGRAKSDINAKEGISGIDPKTILAKLKKLGISKWKYKPSQSKDQSEKIGPMAQDVNKQFGNQAAPGGKKIDLVSMNGIALGGIQGLQDRIDKELGDMKGQSNLEKLVHINTQMYGVLSMIASHGGMGGGSGNSQGGSSGADDGSSFADNLKGHFENAKEAVKGKFNRHFGDHEDAYKGFWNSSASETAAMAMKRLRRGGRKALIGGVKASRFAVRNIKAARGAGLEMAKNSRAMGARKFQDFKDGLPTVGDVYFGSEKVARITKHLMEAGVLKDGEGTVIRTVAGLAEAVGGVFNAETGEMVATHAELTKAYIKSNFEIFSKVFADRVGRAAVRLKNAAFTAFDIGNKIRKTAGAVLGFAGKTAKNFAFELFAPPRDVYVAGEKTPRLLAHSMRLGAYLNRDDGSVIERPTMIKGVVVDLTGEVLINEADLTKGLVDKEGLPFKGIKQRLAEGIRKRVVGAVKGGIMAARLITGAAKGTLKGIRKFMTHGLSGLTGSGGMADSAQSISILEQIRDILDKRLPSGGGSGFMGSAQPENPNAPKPGPGQASQNRDYNGGTNIFSMAGSAISAGASAVKGLIGRRRGRASTATDTDGLREEVNKGQNKQAKEISDLKAGQNKTLKSMKEALKNSKIATVAQTARQGLTGAGVKGDTDGNGLRDNGWQEQKAKMVNSNLPTKGIDDVEKAGDLGTQNTFDMITDFIKKKAAAAKGLMDDGSDLLDDMPDRNKKGTKRAPRTRTGPRGKMPRGPAGRAAAEAAKKAATNAGEKAVAEAAAKTATKTAAKAAGGWGLKKLGMGGLSLLGSIISSPLVIGAAAVGGAAWFLKDVYELAGGKKAPVDGPKQGLLLENLRMAEYGVSVKDSGPYKTLLWLEEYLYPHVKITDGKGKIDEAKIDAEEIVSRFGLDIDNGAQLGRFTRWLEGRFKPNFMKYASAAKTAALDKISDINTMKASNQLSFFKVISSGTVGHDQLDNPFGTASELQMDASRVAEIKQVVGQALEENAKKDAGNEALAKSLSMDEIKKGKVGSFGDVGMAQAKGGIKAGDAAFDAGMDKQKLYKHLQDIKNDKSKSLDGLGGTNVSYTSGEVVALPTESLTALASIRYRLYGLTTMDPVKIAALTATEALASKFTITGKSGECIFSGKTRHLIDKLAKLYGISSPSEMGNWTLWFETRFLPVFTSFTGHVIRHTGAGNVAQGVAALSARQAYAVGLSLASDAGVMKVTSTPWPNYVLSNQTGELQQFVDILKGRAEAQVLQEEKVKPPQGAPSSAPAPDGLKNGSGTTYNIKQVGGQPSNEAKITNAAYSPDAESAPKGGGGSAAPAAPSVGSVKMAAGELFSGSGADAYLRMTGGASLDNANPEMLKLFRGMVEEYGQITGKSVQVNSGVRTAAEQARLYRDDPSKAAKPGSSLHEFGLAVDVNTADADAMEKLGLMRKYGMTRPVGGEGWHVEPAGIQAALAKAKQDQSAAMQMVSYSPGTGGGGLGSIKNGPAKGTRNLEYAKGVIAAASDIVAAEDKTNGTNAATGFKPGASFASNATGVAADKQPATQAPRPTTVAAMSSPAKTNSTTGLMDEKSSNTQSQGQTALNNTGGSGGGYDALPSGGSDVNAMKLLVKQAAETVGIDPNLAATTVAMESSFKSNAQAGTSSASGLYQFTRATWKEMKGKHANNYAIPASAGPQDPKANALLGALYIKQNLQAAAKSGLPANTVTAYAMHLFGPTGGKKFLSMPDGAVPALAMQDAAAANKEIFYTADGQPRTKAQIMAYLQAKLTKAAQQFGIIAPVGELVQAGPDAPKSAPGGSTGPSAGPNTYAAATPAQTAPVQAKPVAPTMSSPNIMIAGQRDQRDTAVGSPGSDSVALVDSINQSLTIQTKQLDIQTKILEILTKLSTEPKPGEGEAYAAPAAPVQSGPDRTPRRISEPVIDMRRSA